MIKYWIGVSAAGMMGLLLFQPAYALESRENSEEGVEGASLLSTQPVQLNELEQPYTTVGEWLEAQAESAIAITNIQLNSTATGVEVILETQGQVAPTTSTVGNALIVEIPNAVLSGDRFEQAEPTAGIALITAESLPGNRVRVVITGTEAPPTATVQTGTQSLMVGITPGTTTADVTDTDAINVVVTAEKTPEDPLDVPISLTVLTEDELEDAQINTIREVAANTPNFFASVGDRVFNFYSIRGIGNSNFLIRDSVGFYLDDVPIEYFHQFFPGDLFDIEQVEILRGPQNTLYGRNSIAGVVNITSRPPSEVLETQLGLEYGTYNQRRVQVSLSDTVIPDTLGFRLSGVYSARDGFTENTLLDEDANAQSDIAGRLNLVWTPSEDWTIAFNALGAASNDGGAVYAAIDQDDPFEIEENEIAELDLSVSAQSLRVAYDGDNFRFTSITAHNFSNVGYRSDGDYTAQDLYSTNLEVISNIWSQEFRFQSPTNAERFNWLVGAYLQNRQFDVDQQQVEYTREGAAFFGIPTIRFGDTVAEYDQDTLAAFGQIDFVPIDPLTLTVGLRYEYSRDDLERRDTAETFSGIVTTSGELDDSIDGDALLPRFAVTYRLNPNVAVYGSVTRGYRPVTLNYTIADASLNDVRQESSWNYEIGVKSSLLDDRLTFSLAGFINEIDDYQVLLPNAQGFFTDITNAQVRVVGFEAEARAIPLEGLELIAGFGFADAEYTDYSNPSTGESFDGNKLTYAPEYTFNLAAQYRSPGGFFSRLELQGLGTYFFDDANTLEQDPFVLVNARIGYEFDNSGVYLFANNLFDQEYFTAAFAPFGTPRANYGDRRVVGIQFQTRF
ncbi:TonB-dependent receptor [bacterium]|nr:TonB-dependent receptor [Leptolyngbyaceae cyanobacterium SM1_4_3]NJL54033.1 TonB-dependent receptor [bacterium]NJO74435.1 TonB-dependent receptor [Leptolyngbyaceae cyanobacterium RM1_406_9]